MSDNFKTLIHIIIFSSRIAAPDKKTYINIDVIVCQVSI